jgi:hypothetical protein
MKRLALFAAVVVLAAACAKKDEGMKADSGTAMAPAPAVTPAMIAPSSIDSMKADSVRKDSAAKAMGGMKDTTKH